MHIYNPEKKFYVYIYFRSNKSKYGDIWTPYYVGKGCNNRAFKTRKFKPKNEKFIKIYACELTEADAFFLEIMLIARYGRIDNGTGYLRNITDGGEGQSGRIISLETRQKLSNRRPSEQQKKKTSLSLKGKEKSSEHKKNISLGRTGNKHPFFGKKNLAQSTSMKNRIWINNGIIQKLIHSDELPHYFNQEFVLGRIYADSYLNSQSANIKGRIWINNGIIQRMIFEKDWQNYASQSFSKGMMPRKTT